MPTSSLCRPGQGQVRPGARFLLLTLDPEEEAVRGALTSGQTDAKGSPPAKVAQRGFWKVTCLGKLGGVGGESGLSFFQDTSLLALL